VKRYPILLAAGLVVATLGSTVGAIILWELRYGDPTRLDYIALLFLSAVIFMFGVEILSKGLTSRRRERDLDTRLRRLQ
jgi:hypothetical protein